MEITYKEISVTAQEVADVFIEKIKSFDINCEENGDFSNKFDFEHEWTIDGKLLTIFFYGRLAGYCRNDKLGDEPDYFEIETRFIEYHEFAAFFDGDDVKINDCEIYDLIEKGIEI